MSNYNTIQSAIELTPRLRPIIIISGNLSLLAVTKAPTVIDSLHVKLDIMKNQTEIEQCPGCHAFFPPLNMGTDRYRGACSGCWAV